MIDINIKIKKLLNDFNSKKINLSKLNYFIGQINKEYEKKNFDYLNALLYPEDVHNVRIPSAISPPSVVYHLKTTQVVEPNTTHGAFLLKFNPYFLAEQSIYGTPVLDIDKFEDIYYYRYYFPGTDFSSCLYNADTILDGYNPLSSNYSSWYFKNMFQVIPNNIYSAYRLISASLSVKYIGPLDRASGILGGAIDFDPVPRLGVYGYTQLLSNKTGVVPPPDPYDPTKARNTGYYPRAKGEGDFNKWRHEIYHTENPSVEGLRLLYFPSDNSFNEYVKINNYEHMKIKFDYILASGSKLMPNFYYDEDYYKAGFNWIVYGQNLPTISKSIRLEFNANFECLPTNEFLNYCPIDVCRRSISFTEQKKIYEIVKDNAIQKIK